jgi:hypothetical protein
VFQPKIRYTTYIWSQSRSVLGAMLILKTTRIVSVLWFHLLVQTQNFVQVYGKILLSLTLTQNFVHLVHLQDSIILEERVISTAHSNAIFREGLFSVELEVLHQHSILDQTTRLFTQLYLSNKPFIDSKLFVKTLKLDPQAHEDIHEFMKGLLKELSDCLSHSKNSKTRSLVEYLFRGSKSFVHM